MCRRLYDKDGKFIASGIGELRKWLARYTTEAMPLPAVEADERDYEDGDCLCGIDIERIAWMAGADAETDQMNWFLTCDPGPELKDKRQPRGHR